MVIINSLQDEVSYLALFGHLIDEAKILVESFTFMSFSHVCSQGNSIVRNLVKHAKHVSGPFGVNEGCTFTPSYFLGLFLISSLLFLSSQFSPCYFLLDVKLASTVNSVTENVYVTNNE